MLFVIHIGSVSWSCCEILFLYVLIRYFYASCMIFPSLLMSHIMSGVCVSLLSIAALYFSQCSSLVLKTVFSVVVLLWKLAARDLGTRACNWSMHLSFSIFLYAFNYFLFFPHRSCRYKGLTWGKLQVTCDIMIKKHWVTHWLPTHVQVQV